MKKLFLVLGATVALSATAFSANAAPRDQDFKPYASVGPWNVIYTQDACYGVPKKFDKPSLAVKMGKHYNSVIVNLTKQAGWVRDRQHYTINFNLGDRYSFHGPAEGLVRRDTGSHLIFNKVPDEYFIRLARASKLNASVPGQVKIPTISLRGSSEMLKTVHQCVAAKL